MGQFSWMFADTQNEEALCLDHICYVPMPNSEFLFEPGYEGYGEFGGHDIYDLVADWNREFLSRNPEYLIPGHGSYLKDDGTIVELKPKRVDEYKWYPAYSDLTLSREQVAEKSGIPEYRWIGIAIACGDDRNRKLPFPIKICQRPPHRDSYFQLPASDNDPNQGWGEDEYD